MKAANLKTHTITAICTASYATSCTRSDLLCDEMKIENNSSLPDYETEPVSTILKLTKLATNIQGK
jgi:hypothetical protein